MRTPARALLLATLVLILVGIAAPASAAPAGAAAGLTFGSQSCQPNGTVSGQLTWTPSGLGSQYVDLAVDAGFASFSTGGPYASDARQVGLTSLTPGRTYFARIRTIAGSQTLPSDTLAIAAGTCAPASAPTAATTGITLANIHSGKCLEIYGFSQANSATANQWGCWGGPNQTLQAFRRADGYYDLRFAHSGKCLEVLGWQRGNGAALGQYTCHGGDNQAWTGNFANGAVSVIRNKFTQKCVDVYGWSHRDGDRLVQWDCHFGNNQQWRSASRSGSGAPAPAPGPVIALTIDTDSIRGNMPQMLDILDRYGVRASIGVTGQWAVANPDLVQRMVAAGHTLMNHSWSHPDFTAIGTGQRFDELQRAEDAILRIGGVSTKPYFRPPYGSTSEAVRVDAASAGYRIILWTIDPQGWRGYSGETITNHILSRAANRAVVLLHSTNAGDLAALGPTIAGLQARGYQLVTIAQLFP